MFDLEKVNQMMNQQQQQQQQNLLQSTVPTDNMNYLAANAKSNLFASALLQQFQQNHNQLNSKLFSNNLILNCIQANAAQLLTQAQSADNQKQINYSRYKTELCRQFIENGECKYGDKCQFAHGVDDLKDVNRHPKYKTDYCKTFHSKGFCPYGPRCHFIHELHEKFDPSIQNVSTGTTKKAKEAVSTKSAEDTQIIDKQLEAIQAQLASSLFVAEESNDNFTVNDTKKQLVDSGSEKAIIQSSENTSNNSFSSGPSSPVTSSISSYTSNSNSTSVSSSTSPVSRVIKKTMTLQEQNFYSTKTNPQQTFFDNTIKSIFDNTPLRDQQLSRSTSPQMSGARARSSVSSTSSACSSSSSSSFEFLCDENTTLACSSDPFSPVKQQKIRTSFNNAPIGAPKNLGPIGRPQLPVQNNSQNMFDIERINSLLIQQQSQKAKINASNFNKNINSQSGNNAGINQPKSFFPLSQDFGAYGQQFYQNSGHSAW